MPYACKTMSIQHTDAGASSTRLWVHAQKWLTYWRLSLKQGSGIIAAVDLPLDTSLDAIEAKAIKMIEEYQAYLDERDRLERRFRRTVRS